MLVGSSVVPGGCPAQAVGGGVVITQPVGLAVEGQHHAAVQQPVQQGGRDGGVAQDLSPRAHRPIGRQHDMLAITVRRNGSRLDASARVLVQRPQQPGVALARYEETPSVVGPVGAAVKRGADRQTGPGPAGGREARKGRSRTAAGQPRDGVPA